MDVADRLPTQEERLGDIGEVVAHQHHIGGLPGHVGGAAHRDAYISGCEGRGIVDAVPHHRHLPLLGPVGDDRLLFFGQLLGDVGVDPCLGGDCFRGALVVSGEHHRCDAELLELGDRFLRLRSQRIGYGDDAEVGALLGDEQGGLPLIGETSHLVLDLLSERDGCIGEQTLVADADEGTVDGPLDALAHQRLEVLCLTEGDALLLCLGNHRLGEGVFAGKLEGGGRSQHLCGILCDDVGHLRLADRQRAGLVEDEDFYVPKRLDGRGMAEEDAHLRPLAACHHDGDRGGETEGTRTGDDQHAHSA